MLGQGAIVSTLRVGTVTTLYNEHDFIHPNELKRYSLGTKNKNLKRNPDGSLTLYAGAESPGGDNEANWLPAPEGHFSLYIRAYWGKLAKYSGLILYKPMKTIPSSAMAYRLLVIREAQ